MNRAFSIYLDLVRFGAAFLVYLYHSNQRWLVSDVLPLSHYGHSAVIVFFVLSGFVIAYVTDTKENHWVSYSASRLSRVYSVVLPTLVLTLLLDLLGRQLRPDVYASYPFDQFLPRIVGSLLMLNEPWFVSITSFSNVPYWSITYEFWYYVSFGLLAFVPGWLGVALAGCVFVLIGPKLLLLAPIWWAGVLLYRWQRPYRMSLALAWCLALGSTCLIIGLHAEGFFDRIHAAFAALVGPQWYRELTFSKFFMADYLLCLLVFAQFAGMRRLLANVHGGLDRIEAPIRWVAGYTFTLYLLHQPLFLFWGSVLRMPSQGPWAWLAVTLMTLLSVLLIGHFTENRRHVLKQALAMRMNGWGQRGRRAQEA